MSTIVKYTNFYGKEVSIEQLNHLNSYRKITIIDGNKKEEKVFDNDKQYVLYYADINESINNILQNYLMEEVHIFHNKTQINGYTKLYVNTYEQGTLTEKSILVENSDGELIFDSDLDINTDAHISSRKYIYTDELDEDGEKDFLYIFNYENGVLNDVDVFYPDDDWESHRNFRVQNLGDFPEYFSWDGIEDYQNLHPIIPNN